MLTIPYVSAAAFRAHPTYLDLDGLRTDSLSAADQAAELENILLQASEWADNQCNQPLGAHRKTQRGRYRLNRQGQLSLHADDTPVIQLTALQWGYSPTSMTAVTDLSGLWAEDDRQLILTLPGPAIPAAAGLQFGGMPIGAELFVAFDYTAGYVATRLGADVLAGATSVTVLDPTGLMPGQSYRIWQPGSEETITVSTTWTPPAATVPAVPTAVPLAAPTARAHTAGHDLSGMPSDMRLAVTLYAIAMLQRPDTASEDEYPGAPNPASLRSKDARRSSAGLVAEATRILASYGRIR